MANQAVQLKDGSNNLYPNPNIVGLDTSNILASVTFPYNNGRPPQDTYTVPQDCIAVIRSGNSNMYINNIIITVEVGSGPGYSALYPIYLKKNDIITFDNYGGGASLKVYGLKYI